MAWILQTKIELRPQVEEKIEGEYLALIQIPDFYPWTRKDIDNYIKPLGDILKTVEAITDDRYCRGVTIHYAEKIDYIKITLFKPDKSSKGVSNDISNAEFEGNI